MFAELINQHALISNFIHTEYKKPTVIVEEPGLFVHKLKKMIPKMNFPDNAGYDDIALFLPDDKGL